MANASLQIGNGNWAIKENDLLGYSKSGTRFLPIPITMTRATLGTRVNPSGLIENVELLGSELVTNGDFSNGSTDWQLQYTGTGDWSITDKLNFENVNGGSAQLNVFEVGKIYKITVDYVFTSGTRLILPYDGSNFPSGGVITTTGSVNGYTYYYTPNSTTLLIYSDGNGNGSIDNVSVKEATIDGLARVDYTDGTASLLVEPQRTNLVTYSEDFTQWSKEATVTLTPNYSTSPDGTNNATRVQLDADDSVYLSSLGSSKTFSIYVKGVAGETIRISNGVATNFTLTGNWDRLQVYDTSGSSTLIGVNTYSSVTARDIQVWGAQLEEGSYPTSYIKTQGSSVTRNKDEYTKTGISDKINSEEGVLFAEIKKDKGTQFSLISLDKSSDSDNYIYVGYLNNTTTLRAQIKINGSIVLDEDVNIGNTNVFSKVAVKYKSGDYAFFINGSKVGNTSTSTDSFSDGDLDRLELGYDLNSIFKFYGNVRQLQIFKTALSDSELATLTT